jgi:hypothetical protein
MFASHVNMHVLAARGYARFKHDARYDLRNVRDGFLSRLNEGGDDTAILGRICDAYLRAIEREPLSNRAYQATRWWNGVRQASLAPVRRALASRDLAALEAMYRNFFRDPCGAGLIGVPYRMGAAYGRTFDDCYARFFLSDALHRIDHWKQQTGNRFDLKDLAGPAVGNPFGVSLEGILIRSGTESQHYFAQRIVELLPSHQTVVAEIGGGFGGMAHYLLRNRPGIRYSNFDLPESIALGSYYLLKSFPHLKFSLYGEDAAPSASSGQYKAALLPVFELNSVSTKSIDLTFSSHTMSDLGRPAMIEYLEQIIRTTRTSFLYVGRSNESHAFRKLIGERYPMLTLVDERLLEWNKQKVLNDLDVECLYQIAAL